MKNFFSKLTRLLKQPAFWVLFVVGVVAVLAFSKIRKPFEAAASKIPGNDLAQ